MTNKLDAWADLLPQQNSKMTFRKRNEEPIEIKLRNQILPSKESTQFLGMKRDSRLNCEEHINEVRAKAKRALYIIKVVAEKREGRDRKL